MLCCVVSYRIVSCFFLSWFVLFWLGIGSCFPLICFRQDFCYHDDENYDSDDDNLHHANGSDGDYDNHNDNDNDNDDCNYFLSFSPHFL